MNIRDAKTSIAASVTPENELRTAGVAFTLAHYEADMNSGVYIITHKISAPDGNLNPIIHIVNTNTSDEYRMVISEAIVSADAIAEWEFYTGTTRTGGGGSLTPVNTNILSTNTLLATTYGSNVADFIVASGSKKYFGRYSTASNFPFSSSWDNAILIGYGTSLGVSCKTAVSASIYVNLLLVSHKIHI